MSPLTIVLIVAVAGLVIWRLISSYWAGADTRSDDVVDGFSPTYGSGSDGADGARVDDSDGGNGGGGDIR